MASDLVDKFTIGNPAPGTDPLEIRIYSREAAHTGYAHYQAELTTETEEVKPELILSGGGFTEWGINGILLTAMYPGRGPANNWDPEPDRPDLWYLWDNPGEKGTNWHVSCKSHEAEDNGRLFAFCMTVSGLPLEMSDTKPPVAYVMAPTLEEYKSMEPRSSFAPGIKASLPPEYVLTGGGARAQPYTETGGSGTLLTQSRPAPLPEQAWVADAKDHEAPSPGKLAVWAIGIHKEVLKDQGLRVIRISALSNPTHPSSYQEVRCSIEEKDSAIIGGGAEPIGPYSHLLHASFPVGNKMPGQPWTSWHAGSKDHIVEMPANVKSWGLAFIPDCLMKEEMSSQRDR